jgi:hypothetical protein
VDREGETSREEAKPDIVVSMSPCEMKRPLVRAFMSSASKSLTREGSVTVGGETFGIFLPDRKDGYSVVPRPKLRGILTTFTSTCISVDQNHDGKIATWESYYAENPLRIGDSMFEVKAIADDGALTLSPTDHPLTGPVLGRKAPDFKWTTIDGETLQRDDFLGRTVILDCWAPT